MSRNRIRDAHVACYQLCLHVQALTSFQFRLILEAKANVRDGQTSELMALSGRNETVGVVDDFGAHSLEEPLNCMVITYRDLRKSRPKPEGYVLRYLTEV